MSNIVKEEETVEWFGTRMTVKEFNSLAELMRSTDPEDIVAAKHFIDGIQKRNKSK